MKKGQLAQIVHVNFVSEDYHLTGRLLEMGLLEGAQVEIVHEAPFGKDPIVVRVRGALIALRRNEANAVEVVLK